MSGLEAEPGPGRAEAQPGRPAGFAGRAQPAPSPTPKAKPPMETSDGEEQESEDIPRGPKRTDNYYAGAEEKTRDFQEQCIFACL